MAGRQVCCCHTASQHRLFATPSGAHTAMSMYGPCRSATSHEMAPPSNGMPLFHCGVLLLLHQRCLILCCQRSALGFQSLRSTLGFWSLRSILDFDLCLVVGCRGVFSQVPSLQAHPSSCFFCRSFFCGITVLK